MVTYWEIAAHSACDTFSEFKYLIVSLVFPISFFWSGNFFLAAPFPDVNLHLPMKQHRVKRKQRPKMDNWRDY